MSTKTIQPPASVPFSRLSAVAKRKAVARDVLQRLKLRQLWPQSGNYVVPSRVPFERHPNTDLQGLVNEGVPCQVCALGGAIVTLAAIEDKIRTDDTGKVYPSNDSTLRKRVAQLLGERQMQLIEAAFEGQSHSNFGIQTGLCHAAAVQGKISAFYNRYPDSAKRFKAIWTKMARTGAFTV